MQTIDLKYGRESIPFEYDQDRFAVLSGTGRDSAMVDADLGRGLDTPIGSPPIEEIVSAGESVLIVVPDATRDVGCGQVANLIVRRLIASGVEAFDISFIFATGIHRPVTDDEKSAILTPFIAQRIKTLTHGPRDLMQLTRVGETSSGIPVDLNRAVLDHDHVIMIGGVTFHYFAGFTGGRKLICPGLASSQTISATHKLAFDCVTKMRRSGVGPGLLDGNAVHQAFVEAAALAPPAFSVNTIINSAGEIAEMFCGDWQESHRAACDAYSTDNTVPIPEKRSLVIASCGGFPFDINLIQAHKALETASHACEDGGTIILLAECAEGAGRSDFLAWFDSGNSGRMAERLCEKYQVNGQTAWSLRKKTERYDVRFITSIAVDDVERLGARKVTAGELSAQFANESGYLLPDGAKLLIKSPEAF